MPQARLTSRTPRQELLKIECTVGRLPAGSRMEWDEHLHLYSRLCEVRALGSATGRVADGIRSEAMTALLGRGFDHRYATALLTRARAGVQPLSVLAREAALRTELGRVGTQ